MSARFINFAIYFEYNNMATISLLERLDGIEGRFDEVGTLITDPNVISDQKRYVKLTKEYHDLEMIMAPIELHDLIYIEEIDEGIVITSNNYKI